LISKKTDLDKYYTKPHIAMQCVELVRKKINEENRKIFIEPSAGNGVFLNYFTKEEKFLAYDICPEDSRIKTKDFLTVSIKEGKDKITIIGNPPFGFSSSIAVKFFNHSTILANNIAFILPRTFRKFSVQNKLSLEYHLITDIDLEKNSFLLDGKDYNVPCCFQIWSYKKGWKNRELVKAPDNIWFDFTDKNSADFSIRRAGGRAGQVLEGTDYTESSTYFIKINKNFPNVKEYLKKIDFSKIRDSTAGVRSVSKTEILVKLEEYLINPLRYVN